MFRLFKFAQIILFSSCITSRNINHFASKNKLTIKKAGYINLFDGKNEIESYSKKNSKDFVYLLYNKDSLLFISNSNRIVSNEFIYKIGNRTDSNITLTRATMFPNYYTVDTLLFGRNFAIEKRCLYDNKQIAQFYFTEYKFSNDTLNINSYRSERDVLPVSLYKNDLNTTREIPGKAEQVKSYPNQDKRTFFKQYIN